MTKAAFPFILTCFAAFSAPARAQATAPIPPERLARHALGRADAAGKLAACLTKRAADLKSVADSMLTERDAAKLRALETELEAAHRALSACLGPAAGPQTAGCGALPPADLGKAPDRLPRARLRIQVVRTKPPEGAEARQARLTQWLTRHQAELVACYLPAAARDPLLAGKATYLLAFGPGGGLQQARLLSTSLANLSVAQCAAHRLTSLAPAQKPFPGASAVVRLVFTVRE